MTIKVKHNLLKNVSYLEHQFAIPRDHRFMAVDSGGELFSYSNTPVQGLAVWYSVQAGEIEKIADVDLNGMDWTETLREV